MFCVIISTSCLSFDTVHSQQFFDATLIKHHLLEQLLINMALFPSSLLNQKGYTIYNIDIYYYVDYNKAWF